MTQDFESIKVLAIVRFLNLPPISLFVNCMPI